MPETLSDIPLARIDGTPTTLGAYHGKVLLIVNVASKCGLTPQYEGLQALYGSKHAAGLEILGFPANDFGAQEPGTDPEIAGFCATTYNVGFPLFSKIAVTGAEQHPLYTALTTARPTSENEGPMRERLAGYGMKTTAPPAILWNFEKFVIGRDGAVIARFSPDTTPDDPKLMAVLETALAA